MIKGPEQIINRVRVIYVLLLGIALILYYITKRWESSLSIAIGGTLGIVYSLFKARSLREAEAHR